MRYVCITWGLGNPASLCPFCTYIIHRYIPCTYYYKAPHWKSERERERESSQFVSIISTLTLHFPSAFYSRSTPFPPCQFPEICVGALFK
jgi:hypothetical protein